MGYTCLLCRKPSYQRYLYQASFHSFPKCPIQKKVWINVCGVAPQVNVKYRKICSFHFEPECFETNKKKQLLKRYAVPTIFVKRFMRKELFMLGILEDKSNYIYGRNNCILCVKSELIYFPRTKIPLHSFPTCQVKRQEWINRCQLTDKVISRNDKICALHFEHECYKSNVLRPLLKPDAVPTIFEMGRYYNRKKSLTAIKVKEIPAYQTNNDHVRKVPQECYPTTMDQTTNLHNKWFTIPPRP